MEFIVGASANLGQDSRYRATLTYSSQWFKENIKEIYVKKYNNKACLYAIRLVKNPSNAAASNVVLVVANEECSSDYTKISLDALTAIDITEYPYIAIEITPKDSMEYAAAYVKFVF